MDIILSEMGEKWKTLSKDQQVALAQAVAGVRQYNQLVSLMDNWDIFEQNLQTAYSSTGSLDEQAEIYSESWQAASKRVKASLQDIYDSIINDEFFIDLLKGIELVIDKVGVLVDSIGGLKGVALAAAVVFTRIFKEQIVKSIDNTIYNIRNFLGNNEKEIKATKEAMYELAQQTIEVDNGEKGAAQTVALQRQLELANLLYTNSDKLSEEDMVRLQTLLDINKALNDQVIIQAQLFDESNNQWDKSRADIRTKFKKTEGAEVKNFREYDIKAREEIEKGIGFQESVNKLFKKNRDEKNKRSLKKDNIDYNEIKTELISILSNYKDNDVINFDQLLKEINTGKEDKIREILENLYDEQAILEDIKVAYVDRLRDIAQKNNVQLDEKDVQNYLEIVEENIRAETSFETAVENEKKHAEQIKKDMEESSGNDKRHKDRVRQLVETADSFSSIGFAITNLKYSVDSLNNTDLTFFDKFMTTLTGLIPLGLSFLDILNNINSQGKAAQKIKVFLASGDKVKNIIDTIVKTVKTGFDFISKMGKGGWIAVAITALSIIVAIVDKIVVTAEEKLIKMEKISQELNEQAEQTKQNYSELIDTISNYKSAKESLQSLTKGTEEFNQALLEANENALKLMQKYPELAKGYKLDESGAFIIDEKAIEDVTKKQYMNSLSAQYASQAYANEYEKAKSENNIRELSREISKNIQYNSINETPEEIASRTDLVEKAIKELASKADGAALLENKEILQKELGLSDSVVEALYLNREKIGELINTLNTSNDLMSKNTKAYTDAAVEEELGKNATEATKKIVSEKTANEIDKNSQDLLAQITNGNQGKYIDSTQINKFGQLYKIGSEMSQEMVDMYNKATGNNWKASNNSIQGSDNNRIFEFIDEEGNSQKVTAEAYASVIAASEAFQNIAKNAEEVAKGFNLINSSARKDMENIYVNKNIDTMTKNEIQENFGVKEGERVSAADAKKYLTTTAFTSKKELEEYAESIGKTAEEVIKDTTEAANNSLITLDNIGKKIESDVLKGIFEKIDFSQFTVAGQRAIEDSLISIYDTFGKQGATDFVSLINSIDKTKVNDVISNFNSINWDGATVQSVREQFEALGISLEEIISDGNLQKIIDLMNTADTSFESASASYNEIKKVQKEIKDNNSIISQESYDTLANAGVAVEAFFTQLADGSYQLVEDANTFSRTLHDLSLRQMREYRDLQEKKVEKFDNLLNSTAEQGLTKEQIEAQLNSLSSNGKLNALLATGNISQGEYDDLANMKDAEKSSQKIEKHWEKAELSGKKIADYMSESLQELDKAQKAIDEADFQYDVESAGLDLNETDSYAKRIAKDMAEQNGEIDQSEESLEKYEKAARKAAIINQRLDRGITNLNQNLETYQSVLVESNKGTAEWSKTMDQFKGDLADLFGFEDADLITDEFAEATLTSEDFSLAIQGNIEAIERLRQSAAEDIMINVVANQAEDPETFLTKWRQFKADFEAINIKGPEVDQQDLIDSFNSLIKMGHMTRDQINMALADIKATADVKTTYIPQKMEVPTTITEEYSLGGHYETVPDVNKKGKKTSKKVYMHKKGTRTYTGKPVEVWGWVPQYSIEGKPGKTNSKNTVAFAPAPQLPAPKISQGAINSGSSGSGGGGGGNSESNSEPKAEPTPAEKKDYTEEKEIVTRYYEITTSIKDMTDALDDASDAADRLYGKDRIKQMEKQRDLLKDQQKLLQQYRKEISNYLAKDKAALQNNKYGIKFSFDADGDITNYTNIMTNLYNQLHAAEQKYNSFATKDEQDTYNESTLEPLNNKIKEIKELIDTYDDTKNLLVDVDNQIQDSLNSWQDKNLEILTYKVELQIEVNDIEQEKLDYFIKKYSDNFYKMAESQALLGDSYPLLSNNLATYQKEVEELNKAYQSGEISQSGYIESLKEVNSNILENLGSLVELDKQMIEYYSNTLDSAQNELGKFTSQLEHQASILEHYKSVISLIGKENNFKMINSILQGQYDVASNQLEVQMKYLKALQRQKKEIESSLAKATGKEKEGLQKQLEAIIPKLNEAEQNVFSLKESIIELSNSILENDLAKFAKGLEKGMLESLGFNSMDKYLETIDRLNTSQEEYLTTTNKIYETNKLIRQVEQDLADTDSLIAKQKYKDYIQNIKKLSEQNRLSKYELEIAQARYEVLKAEIALEEVKNAKDSMRLMRDSSGNWNYVYTANQDKIDQAQQALEDAQNNLYNIGLNGAKDYQSKYAEIMQEAFEAFKEIEQNYKDGMYENDQEYNQARTEAQEYYYNRLKDIQELYQISHGLMVEESYQKEEDYIFAGIGSLEDFSNATNKFLGDCNTAFNKWKQNSQIATDGLTNSMGNLNNKIDKVTNASENLSDQITDNLIPSLEQELDAVRDITQLWLGHRDALFETMKAYEKLQSGIQTTINSAAGVNPGGMLPNIPEQYQQNYAAIMAAYIKQGGNTEDEIFQELLKQRNEKVEWLQAHGFSSDYYGTYGSGTEQYFKEIMGGGGDREWFEYAANVYTLEQIRAILKRIGISTFKTGGYTGDWGDNGKLSILHEKELVLNQDDTKNLLETIKVNKDIKSGGGLLNKLSNLIRNTVDSYKDKIIKLKDSSNTVEQKVDIQATFPNVTNSSEIEQAFNNLVNQAAQYSSLNRK